MTTGALSIVGSLHAAGAALHLWSSCSAQYASASANQLGLTECFLGFLPKPDLDIDARAVDEWRDGQHVLPGKVEAA